MIRKITSLLAAFAFAFATLAPAAADARDRHGRGYDRGHHGYYGRHHDNDDEIAAGVVGLIVGLAIGSMASQPRREDQCYDDYRRCPPPPQQDGYYDQGDDQGYYDQSYEDPRYDEDTRAQYERDYGAAAQNGGYDQRPRICTQQQRRWDRQSGRYIIVSVPC